MKLWNIVFDTPSVSKSCFFYNYRVSHPGADKTFTDGVIKQALVIALKSLEVQPKKRPSKNKKIIFGRNSGPAKAIFGQKSGPAMAGPAVPPTTALH